MNDLFQMDRLLLFVIFFVPGFISMKVYSLLVASEKTNFSQALSEAIGFSAINFASLSWLIIIINKGTFFKTNFFLYLLINIFIIFIAPILWTIFYVNIAKSKYLKKYIISPIKNPWDFFFEQKKSFWVIVNLKNGEKIAGVYSQNSFASAFPHKEQIYLEEFWSLDEKENFKRKKNSTCGILILGEEIKSIEFYK